MCWLILDEMVKLICNDIRTARAQFAYLVFALVIANLDDVQRRHLNLHYKSLQNTELTHA